MLHHEPTGKQDSTLTPQKPIGRRTGHGIGKTILDGGVSHAGAGERASVATGKQLSVSTSTLSRGCGLGWGTSFGRGTECLPQAHTAEHLAQRGELHWKVLEPLKKQNLAGGSE